MTEYNQANIEQALTNLLIPDTNIIKLATEYLKKALEVKENVTIFIEIALTSQNQGLRQTSAVVLRRKLGDMLKDASEDLINQIKTHLLTGMATEQSRVVRKALANLVLAVAKSTESNWVELLQFIDQNSTHEDNDRRNDGSYLLMVLMEESPELFDGLYGSILANVIKKFKDETHIEIISNNLKTILTITQVLSEDEDIKLFKGCTELILAKMKVLLDAGEDDKLSSIMFNLMDSIDPNYTVHTTRLYKKPDLNLLVQFGEYLACHDAYSLSTREMGLNLLETLVSNRRKHFRNKANLQTVIKTTYLFSCLEKVDDYNSEPYEYAMGILDAISNSSNPQYVFDICIAFCQDLLKNENPHYRLVGYYSIGVISEGCQEQMRENLVDILKQMHNGFVDQNVEVRIKSFVSLGYLCEFCVPEICDHHNDVIPYVVQALKEETNPDKVKEKILFSLQSFIDSMDEDNILFHTDNLFSSLIEFMGSTNSIKCRQEALKTVSSILNIAGKKSINYYEKLYLLTKSIIMNTAASEDEFLLLSSAIVCLSNLVYTMDESLQKQLLGNLGDVNQRIVGLIKDHYAEIPSEVKEAVFEYLSSLVQVVYNEFTIIDEIYPIITKSAWLDDILILNEEEEGEEENLMKNEDEDKKYKGMNIRTNGLDEKGGAIHLLGTFAEFLPIQFYKYVYEYKNLLENCSSYFHENIRMQTAIGWTQLAIGLAKRNFLIKQAAATNVQVETLMLKDFQKNYKFESAEDYGQECNDILESNVLSYISTSITTEDSMEVVCRCFDGLRELIDTLGKHFLHEDIMTELLDSMRVIMDGDAMCQISPDDDHDEEDGIETEEEEEDHDRFDHDSKLLGFVSECLSSLCKLLGEDMGPNFETYFKEPIERRAAKSSGMDDKMYVAGVMCDFFKYAPLFMSRYLREIMLMSEMFLNDSNDCLKRNTAFLLGLIAESCKDQAKDFYPKLGQLLEPLLTHAKPEVKDNAIASLARMILSNEENTPSAEQVTTLICSNSPMKGDKQENAALIKLFLYLAKKYPTFAQTKVQIIYETCNFICEDKEKCVFEDYKNDMRDLIQLMQSYNLGEAFSSNQTIVQSF